MFLFIKMAAENHSDLWEKQLDGKRVIFISKEQSMEINKNYSKRLEINKNKGKAKKQGFNEEITELIYIFNCSCPFE